MFKSDIFDCMSVHALKEPKNIIRYVIFLSLKDSINCLLTWKIALLLTFGKLFTGKKTDVIKTSFLDTIDCYAYD